MLAFLIGFAVLNVLFLVWVFARIAREVKTRRGPADTRIERDDGMVSMPPVGWGTGPGRTSRESPEPPKQASTPVATSRIPTDYSELGDQVRAERKMAPQPSTDETAVGSAPARMQNPSVPAYVEVPVFYGTNRAKAADGVWYGTERSDMRYGRCLVTVPTDRRIGTIPRPSIWTLFREKPRHHYILASVEESTGKEAFARGLRESIQNYARRQVLVFVHGFNVAFADAVFRTAQIAADLNFHGAPVLFSWPSKGTLNPLGYTHDETQARWALPDLRAFLELIAEQSGADAIHLLAHSMGNRALTEALSQIAASAARRSRSVFNEVMLTAPDIDADTFVRDIAPSMLPASARVTLYASSNDRALRFSKTVHGYPRAGESGDALVLLDGIDTIDVSAVDTNFVGHFYYGDNRSVLSDLFNLIQGQAAERRFGLRPRKKNERPYWVFQP